MKYRNPSSRLAALLVAAALIVVGVPPALASGAQLQTDCDALPDIMPVSAVREGDRGKSYTVVSGRDIESFDVTIVGVLPDGVGLGVDMILAETSGAVIDDVGGIAFGFSGSPVYIDGSLLGAIAFGFGGAPRLAGITPAEAMVQVLDYPANPAVELPRSVALPDALAARLATNEHVSAADFTGTAEQLPIPVGVSGLEGKALDEFQSYVDARGLNARVIAMSAARESTTTSDPILPGESLGALLATGDVTSGGIGTATFCVDDQVMGWGHPFFWSGFTTVGLAGADIITTVPDESGIFGGFKLGSLAEIHGTVTQDRMTGLLGTIGEFPEAIPVTSHVTGPELGLSRDGRTDVVMEEELPGVSLFHLASNFLAVFDEFGEGSSTVQWSIEGTDGSGESFRFERDNKYYSMFDIAFESSFELAFTIDAILNNPFEDVAIDSVDVSRGEIVGDRRTADIVTVLSATTSDPLLTERDVLFAAPGELITLEVILQPFGSAEQRVVPMEIQVPDDIGFAQGFMSVTGGGSFGGGDIFFEEGFGAPAADPSAVPLNGEDSGSFASLDELLVGLAGADHNNDVIALLELFLDPFAEPPPDEFPPEEEEPEPALNSDEDPFFRSIKVTDPQDEVVFGEHFMEVIVEAPFPPAEELTCNGLPATIVGTSGDDAIVGTPGDDVIVGLGGADDIRGKGGNDSICGNAGPDLISGGFGDDTLLGGNGLDTLRGGVGNDLVKGGRHADLHRGNDGDDIAVGGNGRDVVWGGDGLDKLRGGIGADELHGDAGDDRIDGNEGDDHLDGGEGHDVLVGGPGTDSCESGEEITECE